MTDFQKTRALQDNLDKIIHPKRGQIRLGRSSVFDVLTEVGRIMRLHRDRAGVNDHHLAWMEYHAINPDAVIIPSDLSCKAAVDAANHALEIHCQSVRKR